MRIGLGLAVVCLATWLVAAASSPACAEEPEPTPELGESDFGPLVEIEKIVVVGNDTTNQKIILRALLVAPGDQLRSGDPRFRASRFSVLALGFFRDVQL